MQKRSKKGFTLAELLIVVAIIAVLVAIAVPLFVGALQKAEDATKDANIRAVRGTAAVYLLENTKDTTKLWPTDVESWDVEATVSSTGEVALKKVTAIVKGGSASYKTVGEAVKTDAGGYTITVNLTKTVITAEAGDPITGE